MKITIGELRRLIEGAYVPRAYSREELTAALTSLLDEVARLALGGAPDPGAMRAALRNLAMVRSALDSIENSYLQGG